MKADPRVRDLRQFSTVPAMAGRDPCACPPAPRTRGVPASALEWTADGPHPERVPAAQLEWSVDRRRAELSRDQAGLGRVRGREREGGRPPGAALLRSNRAVGRVPGRAPGVLAGAGAPQALNFLECPGDAEFHAIDPVPFVVPPAVGIPVCAPGSFGTYDDRGSKLLRLSEIVAGINRDPTLPDIDLRQPGTQDPLFCYLDQVAAETAGGHGSLAGGTLVVDREWRVNRPVRVPPFFTLAGVGLGGDGAIRPVRTFQGAAAVIVREDSVDGAKRVVIRDLRIEPINTSFRERQTNLVAGIKFSGANDCYVRNVFVGGFSVGLFCSRAISNWVSNCTFDGNGHNIVFHRGNFNNHVRDCFIRGAECWGIRCFGAADGPDPFDGLLESNGWGNDFKFIGCDIEDNAVGGILANGFATLIQGCRFENNGAFPYDFTILVRLGASPLGGPLIAGGPIYESSGEVKILGNVIAGLQIHALVPQSVADPGVAKMPWPVDGGFGVAAAFNMANLEEDGSDFIVALHDDLP